MICCVCKEQHEETTPWCSAKCRAEVAERIAREQAVKRIRPPDSEPRGPYKAKPGERHHTLDVSGELTDYVVQRIRL